MQYAMKSRP